MIAAIAHPAVFYPVLAIAILALIVVITWARLWTVVAIVALILGPVFAFIGLFVWASTGCWNPPCR